MNFSGRGCVVQDPQTGQLIGIGRKTGCLFELVSIALPPKSIVRQVAATVSNKLWHSRLGHVLDSRLHALVSRGVLGQVKRTTFDCQTCQLE